MHNRPAGAAGTNAASGVGSYPRSHHRHHHLRLSFPPETDRTTAAAAPTRPLALQEHVNVTALTSRSLYFYKRLACLMSRSVISIKRC